MPDQVADHVKRGRASPCGPGAFGRAVCPSRPTSLLFIVASWLRWSEPLSQDSCPVRRCCPRRTVWIARVVG